MTQQPGTVRDTKADTGRIFLGLLIMLIGLAILGDKTGFDGVHLSGHYWPLILIILGVVKMLNPGECRGRLRSRRGGTWLLFVGCWGLVSELRLFGFDYGTSWPLLIIGAGVGIVWRACEDPAPAAHRLGEN